MTGKERAEFRAQANTLEPEFQIGKGGMSEGLVKQTLDSFRTKELIKIKVLLDSAPESPKEFANELAAATKSEVIQVIGGVIVLYKENPDLDKEKEKKKKPAKKTKPLAKVKAKRALAEKKEAERKASKRDFYAKKKNYSSGRNDRKGK